jgi:flagellar hook-associated protein 3 FlgL
MRVTTQMQHQMMTRYISDNQSGVYAKQEQVASGKRMQQASDDPQAWAVASRLHRQDAQLSAYETNSIRLDAQLSSIDGSLSSIGDILRSASEKAVTASGGTLNPSDRTNLAEQVDQLLEELVMQANSKFDGGYQFGGTQTDQEPFVVTRNADGKIDSVGYTGTTDVPLAAVGANDALPQRLAGGGSDGVLISGSSDAFAALIDMRDRLVNGENLAESGVQGNVDAALEHLLTDRARVGAYMEHLTLTDSLRNEQQVQLARHLSAMEDVDVAEAVSELSAKNVAYEAALAISAQIMKTSLLNYI